MSPVRKVKPQEPAPEPPKQPSHDASYGGGTISTYRKEAGPK